jgi:glutathione S-transferase
MRGGKARGEDAGLTLPWPGDRIRTNAIREMSMTITLHDLAGADVALRFSPFCWRTKFALAHKGLDVKTMPWRFREAAKLPKPTGAPGQGRVPVIVDGKRVVADSWLIAEYLEEAYPERPSLFEGAAGPTLFANAWADTVLNPGIFPLIIADLFRAVDKGDQKHFRESREKRLGTSLESAQSGREKRVAGFRASLLPLRTVLAAQDWLAGAEPGYADYIVAGSLMWAWCASRFELLAEDDVVSTWFARVRELHDGLGERAVRVPG